MHPHVKQLDNYVRGKTWVSNATSPLLKKYSDGYTGNRTFYLDFLLVTVVNLVNMAKMSSLRRKNVSSARGLRCTMLFVSNARTS